MNAAQIKIFCGLFTMRMIYKQFLKLLTNLNVIIINFKDLINTENNPLLTHDIYLIKKKLN